MSFVPINPRPMLNSLIDKDVSVRLKWDEAEYRGRLVSVDSYMNIQMDRCEEWREGKLEGTLGLVLIRCNNVLWVADRSTVKGANGDVEMRG